MIPDLQARTTPGARVERTAQDTWCLSIPSGPAGQYRLAQMDDYASLARRRFPWKPPRRLTVRARASAEVIPGTWGIGLWNDPFALSLGLGGASRRLPALPNAAWFFFASPPNYLSLRDDLPARGPLAGTFRSPNPPAPLLAPGLLTLPLLALPPAARLLRRLARSVIRQDAAQISYPDLADRATSWHAYGVEWWDDRVCFRVDGHLAFQTSVVPRPALGLVIWVDNQYAALPPDGRLRLGNLANPQPAWIEISDPAVD